MKIALLGTHVAQPTETVKPQRKRARWKAECEGRFAAGLKHAAGKWKPTGDDFLRDMRIDGAQIGRRHDQALGSVDGMTKQAQAQKCCATKHAPPSLPQVKMNKPGNGNDRL
jgi:hypothetical protein